MGKRLDTQLSEEDRLALERVVKKGSMTFRMELDKPVKTCRGGLAGWLRL